MATIRLELYTSKTLKGGRHPITITVSKDGIIRRKTIGSALPHQWEEGRVKKMKDQDLINQDIDDALLKYKKKFRSMQGNWKASDFFKEDLKQMSTLYELAEEYLEYIKLVKSGQSYFNLKAKLEKIKRYSPDLPVSSIDNRWINGFVTHCKTKEKSHKGGEGNSDNTINAAIKLIKRIVSFAGLLNDSLSDRKLSYKKPVRRKLTSIEIERIKLLVLNPGDNIWHARNFFLLAIYLRGIRAGDLLQIEYSDIKNGRLIYDSDKTGHPYDMKLVAPALEILSLYKGKGRIFPFLKPFKDKLDKVKRIKAATSIVNQQLEAIREKAGIEKRISTHIARHTFASLSDKKIKDVSIIQDLLGHGSRSMTEGYLADLRESDELDDATDRVFE